MGPNGLGESSVLRHTDSSSDRDDPNIRRMDPYVVLGVKPDSTPAEIDDAYARRRRLHDPANQTSESDRSAAERFQAELGDAYQALLGTAPPSSTNGTAGQPGVDTGPRHQPKRVERSPGRDWLFFLGAVLVAYVVLQVPLALGFGFGGAVVGWIAAIGVMVGALVKLRNRS